jgi:hypothetical protein
MLSKGTLPRLASPVLALSAISCASVTLTPGADKVRFTENPSDVAGCKALGEVTVEPAPFQTNSQGHNKLKNAALALGGNTVLQTFGGAHSGSGSERATMSAMVRPRSHRQDHHGAERRSP